MQRSGWRCAVYANTSPPARKTSQGWLLAQEGALTAAFEYFDNGFPGKQLSVKSSVLKTAYSVASIPSTDILSTYLNNITSIR